MIKPIFTKPMQANHFPVLTRFLCRCSGAYPALLAECPTEINKYAGIGATILFTGLLASISGGYALYSIFGDSAFSFAGALVFGLLWGLLIFNLDRYIVSSLRKGKQKGREWLMAIPRLLIALVISVVIAKPLEVRIFQDRIERQLHETQLSKLMSDKAQLESIYGSQSLESQIQGLSQQVTETEESLLGYPQDAAFQQLLSQWQAAERDYQNTQQENEQRIESINGQIQRVYAKYPNRLFDSKGRLVAESLPPAVYREVNDLKNQSWKLHLAIQEKKRKAQHLVEAVEGQQQAHQKLMGQRLAQLRGEQQQLLQRKATADSLSMMQLSKGQAVNAVSYRANFITQLEALGELTHTRFSTIWWASWCISLLFVLVETSPIVVKLLTGRGPYDAVLERHEYEALMHNRQKALAVRAGLDLPKVASPPPTPAAGPTNRAASPVASAPKPSVQIADPWQAVQQPVIPAPKPADSAAEKEEALPVQYLQVIRNGIRSSYEPPTSDMGPLLQGKTWKCAPSQSTDPAFDCLVFRKSYQTEGFELMCIRQGEVSYGQWVLEAAQLELRLKDKTWRFAIEQLDTAQLTLVQAKSGQKMLFSRIA